MISGVVLHSALWVGIEIHGSTAFQSSRKSDTKNLHLGAPLRQVRVPVPLKRAVVVTIQTMGSWSGCCLWNP